MTKHELRMQILDQIYGDVGDREEQPSDGLIPDWYVRYRKLCNMVVEYMNTPPDQSKSDPL